eukprot:1787145-Rhodomonas_salina.1
MCIRDSPISPPPFPLPRALSPSPCAFMLALVTVMRCSPWSHVRTPFRSRAPRPSGHVSHALMVTCASPSGHVLMSESEATSPSMPPPSPSSSSSSS